MWLKDILAQPWFIFVVLGFSFAVTVCFYAFYYRVFKISHHWRDSIFLAVVTYVLEAIFILFQFGIMLRIITFFDGILDVLGVYSLFIIPFLSGLFLVLIIRHFVVNSWLKALAMGSLGSIIAFGVFAGLTWILIGMSERCGVQLMTYHEFNAHLKDVCIHTDKGECPRDESALKSFEVRKFDDFKSCFKTKYWFDEKSGKYAWVVQELGHDYILVSHPDLNEGFAGYVLNKTDHSSDGTSVWPPKVYGPWESLLPD